MMHCPSADRFAFTRAATLVAALLLLGSLSCIFPQTAWATSSCSGTTTVTVSGSGVAFGNYDVMNAAATPGTGTITISSTCNFNFSASYTVDYAIALSTGSSGSFTPRNMTSGTSALQYNLYTTAALSTIWGDSTGGTQTLSGSLTGSCQLVFFFYTCNTAVSQNSTTYGNIPAMQNIVAGNYADTITVTVSF